MSNDIFYSVTDPEFSATAFYKGEILTKKLSHNRGHNPDEINVTKDSIIGKPFFEKYLDINKLMEVSYYKDKLLIKNTTGLGNKFAKHKLAISNKTEKIPKGIYTVEHVTPTNIVILSLKSV